MTNNAYNNHDYAIITILKNNFDFDSKVFTKKLHIFTRLVMNCKKRIK